VEEKYEAAIIAIVLATAVALVVLQPWKAPEKPKPGPRPGQGTISVSTTPTGAEVYVGGTYIGTAPVSTNVDPGTYTVRAVYQGQSKSKSVTVQAGETSSVSFTFGYTIQATAGVASASRDLQVAVKSDTHHQSKSTSVTVVVKVTEEETATGFVVEEIKDGVATDLAEKSISPTSEVDVKVEVDGDTITATVNGVSATVTSDVSGSYVGFNDVDETNYYDDVTISGQTWKFETLPTDWVLGKNIITADKDGDGDKELTAEQPTAQKLGVSSTAFYEVR